MENFLQLVLRVTNSQKYCIHLTLFSEIICCRVVLVFLVCRKVLECTFPSVLMRMWLVLVTARATLSGSGLARSSRSFDKHWRAWQYLVDKIVQRSSGEISNRRVIKKEKRQDVCSWKLVLCVMIVTVSQCHSVTQSNRNSRFVTSSGQAGLWCLSGPVNLQCSYQQ